MDYEEVQDDRWNVLIGPPDDRDIDQEWTVRSCLSRFSDAIKDKKDK